jgi:hypothetical protein
MIDCDRVDEDRIPLLALMPPVQLRRTLIYLFVDAVRAPKGAVEAQTRVNIHGAHESVTLR